jgi:predicted methyltransferase
VTGRLRLLPLAALLLATPLAAKPADYAKVVADSARTANNRALDESRMPAEILDFAGVKSGETVVDYYAGGGYYTELLSRVVGSKGAVYSTNPPPFYDAKTWDALTASHPNVRVLVAPVPGMKFAPASVDVLFNHLNFHDLYWESEKDHYPRIDVPAALADWFAAVKPGGHVIIVDHVGPAGDPREVVQRLHRIDPERVKADMAAAGFVLEAESSLLRRSEDGHDKNIFDPAIRGKTDRFVLKFRRP